MRDFSLAVILRFVDKGASTAIGKVGSQVEKLRKSFAGVGKGAKQMGRGMRSLALAGAPAAAALGLIVKKGADFEQSVARLRSKLLADFDPALKAFAKTLGATTKFSATQAADAMTNLAQAGFSAKEIIAAVPGVLNAAAAEGIDLATASNIVAANVRSFGLEASEAARVAGVLALASTKANTDIVQLQEGLKLASTTAKLVGAPLTDTVAVLGALADVGLKGTLSGTAFKNALVKLTNPTSAVKDGLKGLKISIGSVTKQLDKGDVVGTFGNIVTKLLKVKGAAKRTGIAMKIFGLRGAGIAAAMAKSGKTAAQFEKTLELLRNETGSTAKAMADIQIDTLTGQMTLLNSAVEGVSIELSQLIGSRTKGFITDFAGRVQNLALAFRVLSGEKIVDPKARAQIADIGDTTFDIAQGIRDAITDIKDVFSILGVVVKDVASALGLETGAKGIARITTKLIVLTAAMAPLGIAILGITTLMGGFGNVALGASRVAFGAIGGVSKGLAAVLGKIPVVGKFASKLSGRLGGAAGAAAKATAQPVRVVNFDEIGGVGGALGRKGGAASLGAEQAESGKRFKLFRRTRGLLERVTAKFGRTGAFLNQGVGQLGKGFGGVAKGLLARAGLVAAVGAAGFAFGTFIDKTFGLSEKISDFFIGDKLKKAAEVPKKGSELVQKAAIVGLKKQAEIFAKLAEAGGKKIGAKGAKVDLTRENVEKRLAASLTAQGVVGQQQNIILARLERTLRRIPAGKAAEGETKKLKVAKDAIVDKGGLIPVSAGDVVVDRSALARAVLSGSRGGLIQQAVQGAPEAAPAAGSGGPASVTVPVTVMLDGREVALAVAQINLDDMERSGAFLEPGVRGALQQRGSKGAFRRG